MSAPKPPKEWRAALKLALAQRRWRDVAAIAARATQETAEPAVFETLVAALVRLDRNDAVERLLAGPCPVEPRRASRLRLDNALATYDLVLYLRRLAAHARAFGLSEEERAEAAPTVAAMRLSAGEAEHIVGSPELTLAFDLPERPAKPAGDGAWLTELAAVLNQEDLPSDAALLARDDRLAAARDLFFSRYDWLATYVIDPRLTSRLFSGGEATDGLVRTHLSLAAWRNGARSPEAQIAHVEALYGLRRTDAMRTLLAVDAPRPELAVYRVLAFADRGEAAPPARLAPAAETDEDHGFDKLEAIRRAALAGRRPRRLSTPARPRVAVCVSGQLRGFRETLPPFLAALRAQAEVDVFVSTWAEAGGPAFDRKHLSRNFSPEVADLLARAEGEVGEAVREALPALVELDEAANLKRQVRKSTWCRKAVYDDASEAERRILDAFPYARELGLLNQFKMFYKIHAANELARQAALDDDRPYDLVVRMRPDLEIGAVGVAEWRRRLVDSDQVAVPGAVASGGLSDIFAVGSPDAMERYASVWPRMLAAGSHRYLPTVKRGKMAEPLLLRHVYAEGLSPLFLRETAFGGLVSRRYDDREVADALAGGGATASPLRDALRAALAEKHGPGFLHG